MEEIQNNSVKFSKLESMATHCPLFARINREKHSSLRFSTSAEYSAEVGPA